MKRPYIPLLLFLAQVYLTFCWGNYFTKYENPPILFGVSLLIGILYWRNACGHNETAEDTSSSDSVKWRMLGALAGLCSILLCSTDLANAFAAWSPPSRWSDVIPQIETLYTRFAAGEFPYAPVVLGEHKPYPVYMPLHWLPIGLKSVFGSDVRWIGFWLLALSAAWYGWRLMPNGRHAAWRITAIFLPSFSLWGFILYGEMDIPVSFELVVAAYYLFLASSLGDKKTIWVTVGIILCLLSRYTLFFWLPLFAFVFYGRFGMKKSLYLWGAVAAAVILLYVLPFVARRPEILSLGLKYHNNAAVGEWVGYDNISWTMERGVHFAIYLKEEMHKSPEAEVGAARIIQAACMLLLFLGGCIYFWRNAQKTDAMQFSLLMLYLFMLFFYTFGPLTYRYYLVVLQMVSAVMCGRMIVSGARGLNNAQ